MKKNMKIAITPEQKIGEVVGELERLGYKKAGWIGCGNTSFITTCKLGFYTDHAISFWSVFGDSPLNTLAELKEMK